MHLLDANALIALGWPAHAHHEAMQAWFARQARGGWATTAFTQAAFVRVVSQPAFSGRSIGTAEIAELLLRNLAHPKHELVPLDFGYEEVQDFSSFFWTEDEINVRLDKIMIGALKKIWDTADRYKITLRTATFAVACERILMAREERGLYP